MEPSRLEELLTDATVHREVLGQFDGPYTLGIGQPPAPGVEPELILQVDADDQGLFKQAIVRDGERIKISVETGFKPPLPLKR